MASEVALERMQRWMQAVIVHPGPEEEAVTDEVARKGLAPAGIADVILPSKTLTPTERVGIYHGMYLLRMEEALAADYPGLKHFLGNEGFFELVRGYVQEHPSTSYSLNPLGDHMPEYVKTAPGIRKPQFCAELAQLELAVTHVFDAPETPPVRPAAIAAVPPEAWEKARLQAVAAFRLLSFRYPVNAYLQTVRDENHDHPKVRRKDEWVAIYRRDYGVYRLELSRPAHDLLADLIGGTPLGDAVATALKRGGRRVPTEDELFRWFREWVSGGVFRSVSILGGAASPPPDPPPLRGSLSPLNPSNANRGG